jgi:hypothetical protein
MRYRTVPSLATGTYDGLPAPPVLSCKGNYCKHWDGRTCLATPWARGNKWSPVCPFTVTSARKIRVTFSEFGVASSPTTIETADNGTFGG